MTDPIPTAHGTFSAEASEALRAVLGAPARSAADFCAEAFATIFAGESGDAVRVVAIVLCDAQGVERVVEAPGQ